MSRTSALIIVAAALVIIALHCWGALSPAHINWGFHFYAFHDAATGLAALAVALLALIPLLQLKFQSVLEAIIRFFSKLAWPVVFVVIAAAVLAAGAQFPAQLHLLGDGALLLRSLGLADWGTSVMASFTNQPFLYALFRAALKLNILSSSARTYDFYMWIDRFAAVAFLWLAATAVRTFKLSGIEKFFLGALLVFGGGCQFFFGYVENYVLLYVFTAAYLLSGWFTLERGLPLFYPIVAYAVTLGCHIGGIVLAPTLVYVIYAHFGQRRLAATGVVAGLGGAGLGALWALGYNPLGILQHFGSGNVDFLNLFETGGGNYPYPMFSLIHLADWCNALVLMAPFAVALAVVAFLTLGREFVRRPATIFLGSAAMLGLMFTWAVNASLGMARDWDLLSSFFVPLMVFAVYAVGQIPSTRWGRYALGAATVLALLHCAGWIGVNASADKHLRRVEMLDDARLLSPTTFLWYDEALANFFFDTQQYAGARVRYEHYVSIDPDNLRIIGNLSDVYRKLGEREKYFAMLQEAVRLGSKDPGIYSNLGVEFAGRKDTAKAIEYNEQALTLNPRQVQAHANLGILYASRQQFAVALDHFTAAIDLGMHDPPVYHYAADVSYMLGDYSRAIRYYDTYLGYRPTDQRAIANRQRALAAVRTLKPPATSKP